MDEELVFDIQGGLPEPHRVVFARRGADLAITCTCRPASLGKFCKHRLALLKGDCSGLVAGSPEQVARLPILIRGTKAEAAVKGLLESEGALVRAEAAFQTWKQALLAAIHPE